MMNCENAQLLLIDYLDNELSSNNRKALDQHLGTCESCKRELLEYQEIFKSMASDQPVMPGEALRENFDTMLQSEINILATTNILDTEIEKAAPLFNIGGLLVKVAACIFLLAGGIAIGSVLTSSKTDKVTSAQMASLETEVKEMKEAVMLNLLNDESASERIKAVTYVEQMNNPGEDVMRALINTLNVDQNVNVRLAALNSISKFSTSQVVRDSLVNSLRQQTEPIVQIILINILTDKKESKAIGPMKAIISDKSTLEPVKQAAAKGLKLL